MIYKHPSSTYLAFLLLITLSVLSVSPRASADDQPRVLFPFGFGGLDEMSVNGAVDMLMDLGYAGIIPQGRTDDDLLRLDAYLDRSELEGENFNVMAYYLNHKIYENAYDDSVHKEVIDILAARGGGILWMAVRAVRDTDDYVDYEKVDNFIKGVFEYATGEDEDGNYRNVNIVFYPHVNNAYESTIEALPLVEEIND